MKIVLFKNIVESQEFFSFELAKCFSSLGHEIFFYDCGDPITSKKKLDSFVEPDNTVFFSFNFNGMINDPVLCKNNGKDPVYLKETGIPFVNFVVDHPYYYHKEFENIPQNYIQISIDENHADYMKKYFPEIDASTVIYLGGTKLVPFETGVFNPGMKYNAGSRENLIPFEKRKDDIVFCGNYMEPAFFDKYLKGCEQPVVDFYNEIYEELKAEPDKTLEDVAERKILQEFGERATRDYLRDCLENMIVLDLKIRHYFRGRIVEALADSGVKITVYGEGYDRLPLKHPENVINMGNVDSLRCLKAIANARVSLNIMPWFKRGGHDRVYNTCLNGALCLSDTSEALKTQFKDMMDISFFDIKNREDIAEKYARLTENPAKMKEIAEAGYENALKNHSWYNRALEIEKVLYKALKQTNVRKNLVIQNEL